MLFREVLPEVARVLAQQTWLNSTHTVTVIRDLRGLVRVLVETTTPKATADRDRLESDLRNGIGDWLPPAAHEPILLVGPGSENALKALLELVKGERRPWEGHRPGTFQLFLLERHAGKRGWVGDLPHAPPWSLDEVDQRTQPPIVTFFSQKGGVGRSTALVATALSLCRKGHSVFLVDLDLEAPGLGKMLLHQEPPNGLIDWLVNPEAVPDLGALVTTLDEPEWTESRGKLQLLPAGQLDPGYLQMLARVDFQASQRQDGLQSRLHDLFIGLRAIEPRTSIFLVDARAGLHELGGVMLAALSHLVVFVGTTNEQSWFGLQSVARTLARDHRAGRMSRPIPLKVVQGLAWSGEEGLSFRADVYRELSETYYADPAPTETTREAHYPIRLLWDNFLLGRGGRLEAEVTRALQREYYLELAQWIADRFLPESSSP